MSFRSLSCIALLVTAGCARNAVLDAEIDLPPGPADRYAVVQFENQDADFMATWGRTDAWAGAPLTGERQTVTYSLVSETPSTRVRVKVNFCTTPDCSDASDVPDRVPAVWYELERAFYRGRYTTWRVSIPTVPLDPPSAPITVDRCAIAGCIRADDGTESFCRVDGTHFCE